ncbi:MAG: ABC transporter substrate-binding protein, partial [candidate division WOR-3 bacterium]
ITVGSGTFINELVARAGGRNVFSTALQQYPVIDGSAVVEADPEVILILHPGTTAAEVKARVGWSGIRAVRTNQVYDGLDEDLFSRPGPRIVGGVELLAHLLRSRNEE